MTAYGAPMGAGPQLHGFCDLVRPVFSLVKDISPTPLAITLSFFLYNFILRHSCFTSRFVTADHRHVKTEATASKIAEHQADTFVIAHMNTGNVFTS